MRACQRCRKQKLKCDAERPCVPCTRSNAECVPVEVDIWRSAKGQDPSRRGTRVSRVNPRQSRRHALTPRDRQSNTGEVARRGSLDSDRGPSSAPGVPQQGIEGPNSSSTAALMNQAMDYHEADESSSTGNLESSGRSGYVTGDTRPLRPSLRLGSLRVPNNTSSRKALLEVLPSREPAMLLMNTYFDRVHWFMLLFHQDDFRASFDKLLQERVEGATTLSLSFLGCAAAVCMIGLQYVGDYRKRLLASHHIDPEALTEQMLQVFKSSLLDLLAEGRLESVQATVLLGTFYLYHGDPNLAWPVCGCGLRIAQSLGLHRSEAIRDDDAAGRRSYEARKRCWWAVYEVETYCCMLYGLPPSINDSDCSVEHLRYDDSQTTPPEGPFEGAELRVNMLVYKPFMSKLSRIIKEALTQLYGRDSHSQRTSDQSSSVVNTLSIAEALNSKLRAWYGELPPSMESEQQQHLVDPAQVDGELERSIGASGPVSETVIVQLQALSLRLAYQNARILVNRPLLAHKLSRRTQPNVQLLDSDVFASSVRACRDAALQTSELGSQGIFLIACRTYAASFIGMHLLTAGIMLSILASLEPLGAHAHELKMGLQRLIQMQTQLSSANVSADNGADVLKRLAALVVEKELRLMVGPSTESRVATHADQEGRSVVLSAGQTTPPLPPVTDTFAGRRRAQHDRSATGAYMSPPAITEDLSTATDLYLLPSVYNARNTYNQNGMEGSISAFDQAIADMSYAFDLNTQIEPMDRAFADYEQGWIWGVDFSA